MILLCTVSVELGKEKNSNRIKFLCVIFRKLSNSDSFWLVISRQNAISHNLNKIIKSNFVNFET